MVDVVDEGGIEVVGICTVPMHALQYGNHGASTPCASNIWRHYLLRLAMRGRQSQSPIEPTYSQHTVLVQGKHVQHERNIGSITCVALE